MANLFTGQFLFKAPDADTISGFRRQASKWGFDETSYIQALLDVPVISEKRIKAILHYLKQFSEMIGEMGFSRLKLAEKDEAVESAHATLKIENQQREAEARKLTQILEGNSIPTFVVDSDHIVTHWNRACEVLTKIPATDIVGTAKHQEAFHLERRELMADLIIDKAGTDKLARRYGDKYQLSQLIPGGYDGEDFFPKIGKTGKWLFFTAAPLKDTSGNVLGAIETIQDTTDRRMAERALRDSEARYRQLFEFANDAIFLLNDGIIVDCNQKALDLFTASRKDMIGRSPLSISPDIQPNGRPSKDGFQEKESIALQEQSQFFEWCFLRKDGSQFDAEVSSSRFKINDLLHALAIVRDISGQKKMIQALQLREKELAEKSSYLEKVNLALKASLDHREVEKRAVEENMLVNLKRFVFPYIEELGKCKISTDAKAYLKIVDTNLNGIVSQFSQTVFSKYLNFTPTEVRIADFIRGGKNSKEIAQLLGLSPSSVQWHRKNIREKLGLTNKKVNLHTYLMSLSE